MHALCGQLVAVQQLQHLLLVVWLLAYTTQFCLRQVPVSNGLATLGRLLPEWLVF